MQGIELARQLEQDKDFLLNFAERKIVLTETGQRRLERLCAELGGVWAGLLRREELASQALSALHLFARDEHYLVRDGKIQIIDEYTGRIMADRSWERGLHQLVEAKEGCKITAQFQVKQVEEYFERLDKCGLPERKERSQLYKALELGRANLEAMGLRTH